MRLYIYIFSCILFISCSKKEANRQQKFSNPYILILGVAQDAGYPQIACQKECCQRVYQNPKHKRSVSSIALVDPISNESWVFDATPDFTDQSKTLSRHLTENELPDGIFLTHGHVGHYTGLMYLGREAMGARNMPVYVMPRMKDYLATNGPWSQLVTLNNIELREIRADSTVVLNDRISVLPIEVPHRDEFSETVGYMISNKSKRALFIPDIDKWSKWNQNIVDLIKEVDIALIDATFFKDGEIDRDMNEVPHPFVEESMQLFENLSEKDKRKIYFIHFNHTNPLLIDGSEAQQLVKDKGFNVSSQEAIIEFN